MTRLGRCERLGLGVFVLVLVGGGLSACKDSGDDTGSGPNKETFCAKVNEFNTGTQAFDLNVADDAEVEQMATLLDEIADAAPEEIRDDVEARFAYVDEVIAASRGDDEAASRLADAEPTDEEQARIDAYAQQECGVALEPGAPPTTIAGGTVTSDPAATLPPATVPGTTATTAPTG